MIYKIFQFANSFSPGRGAQAHCDIPCGIYVIEPARTAASTVAKMVEKITALPSTSDLQTRNSFARMVQEKEEQAQKCKEELLILWTDYFKPEHLAMFPNLHETFWKAAKLCSYNKQNVDSAKSQELMDAVAKISDMFAKAEAAKKK